jgi:hypothetical protein
MPLDDIFDYLRKCGGTDTLVFASVEEASKARDLIQHQLAEDDVAFDKFPHLDLFDATLRTRLKEYSRASKPVAETEEVF